ADCPPCDRTGALVVAAGPAPAPAVALAAATAPAAAAPAEARGPPEARGSAEARRATEAAACALAELSELPGLAAATVRARERRRVEIRQQRRHFIRVGVLQLEDFHRRHRVTRGVERVHECHDLLQG